MNLQELQNLINQFDNNLQKIVILIKKNDITAINEFNSFKAKIDNSRKLLNQIFILYGDDKKNEINTYLNNLTFDKLKTEVNNPQNQNTIMSFLNAKK